METKVCSECGKEKPLTRDYFHYSSREKSGFRGNCIDCVREYKQSYLQNKRGSTYKPRIRITEKNRVPKPERKFKRLPNRNKKVPFTLVEETFEKHNYILLSNNEEYHNSTTKLKYKCKNHLDKGILTISWSELNRGTGCKYCGLESRSKKRRLPFQIVKNEFIKRGFTLLDSEYINAYTPMRYVCPNHPDKPQTITYTNLRGGHGCMECGIEANKGEKNCKWKGGISPLRMYLRGKLKDWKYKSLKESNFRCVITGIKGSSLEIHHPYSFNKILEESLLLLNIPLYDEISKYNLNELKLIEEKTLELHFKYGLGIVITKELHKLFHLIYGYGDNNPEQFEEFKNNYKNYLV